MNRNADLLIGKLTLANDHKPIRRSALQSAGSWSQGALREVWRLPMNRPSEHGPLSPRGPDGRNSRTTVVAFRLRGAPKRGAILRPYPYLRDSPIGRVIDGMNRYEFSW
jgi:hypothetical protein